MVLRIHPFLIETSLWCNMHKLACLIVFLILFSFLPQLLYLMGTNEAEPIPGYNANVNGGLNFEAYVSEGKLCPSFGCLVQKVFCFCF